MSGDKASARKAAVEAQVDAIMQGGDANNDGVIDEEEFKTIVLMHYKQRLELERLADKDVAKIQKHATKLFRKLDKDKSHGLDRDEMVKYIKKVEAMIDIDPDCVDLIREVMLNNLSQQEPHKESEANTSQQNLK